MNRTRREIMNQTSPPREHEKHARTLTIYRNRTVSVSRERASRQKENRPTACPYSTDYRTKNDANVVRQTHTYLSDHRIVLCSVVFFRRGHGLVGPCSVVASPQLVAHQDPVHVGPVRSASGRETPVHQNAQDRTRPVARPALRGHARGLFDQDVQRRHTDMQRTQ